MMKEYTTFRIGGPCRLMLFPETEEQVMAVLALLRKNHEEFFVLGRGSNLLVSDRGYDGIVVALRKNFSGISVNGTEITALSGSGMIEIARVAMENGLTGFEFASGIPGTVGGGVMMNAGAYGGELKDVLKSARVLLPDGSVKEMTPMELEMGYRTSALPELDATVLSVIIRLTPGDRETIKNTMDDLSQRRREKQPIEYGSAGSTFKRPVGFYAGPLIENAGLKGYRVGDACVSEKHAGFVVNLGNATAADVLSVVHHVQKVVLATSGVELECEDKFLGEF